MAEKEAASYQPRGQSGVLAMKYFYVAIRFFIVFLIYLPLILLAAFFHADAPPDQMWPKLRRWALEPVQPYTI